MFDYGSRCSVRIQTDPRVPFGPAFEATGTVSLPPNEAGDVIACVWDVDELVGWCENYDLLLCRTASDAQSLVAIRKITQEELERVGEFQKARPSSPQDLLMAAVCNDDAEAAVADIDAALAQGANFSDEGVEPLYWAASGDRAAVVRHLIERGATIAAEWPTNSRDEVPGVRGDTALHAAAETGNVEILRLLLGSDGRQFIEKYGQHSGWRRTPLGVAAARGHIEACRVLLDAGADVNGRDEFSIGETPLCEAVQEGHAEVARLLLAAGADPTIPGWMSINAIERAHERPPGDATRQLLQQWADRGQSY